MKQKKTPLKIWTLIVRSKINRNGQKGAAVI